MFDPLTRARDSFAQQGFLQTIGAEILEMAPGRCVLAAKLTPALTQQHGYGHAGVSTTLADTAAGYAAYTLMPEGAEVLTTEFKMNLLRPAKGDRLVAEAVVLKPGRTISVVEAEVWAETEGRDRKLVAKMSASMICLMS